MNDKIVNIGDYHRVDTADDRDDLRLELQKQLKSLLARHALGQSVVFDEIDELKARLESLDDIDELEEDAGVHDRGSTGETEVVVERTAYVVGYVFGGLLILGLVLGVGGVVGVAASSVAPEALGFWGPLVVVVPVLFGLAWFLKKQWKRG